MEDKALVILAVTIAILLFVLSILSHFNGRDYERKVICAEVIKIQAPFIESCEYYHEKYDPRYKVKTTNQRGSE